MKHTFHLATADFCFVEQEFEGTPQEAQEAYKALESAFRNGGGLSTQDFNKVLDEYLETGTVKEGTEYWAEMDERQKWLFNEIKKSVNRRK